MAANLEEPGRSRALHILNKALIYRNLTPPKPNIPLTVPFLAHDDFTKHCQQWLRTTIQHKQFTIPLHLPSHRLREAEPPHMGGHPPLPARSSRPPLRMRSPSHPLAGSRYPHHQRPLHSYTGPTPTPYTPRHFPQRQYEQHLLPKQSSILPHIQDGLHKMTQTTRASAIPRSAFAAIP